MLILDVNPISGYSGSTKRAKLIASSFFPQVSHLEGFLVPTHLIDNTKLEQIIFSSDITPLPL